MYRSLPTLSRMPITVKTDERVELIASLKRYFREEFDTELTDLKSGMLLDFILKEVAPVAYNAGVRDAESFLRRSLEDLPGTCFESPLTYWRHKTK